VFCAGLLAALAVPAEVCRADEAAAARQTPVEFNRDIRPILSDTCFQCHGPDERTRKAGLRLDVKEQVLQKLESGAAAIVPGKLAESELYQRITTTNEAERMPPTDSGKQLSPQQIQLLKNWIEQGAPFEAHWSFVPPRRRAPPEVREKGWRRNPIDDFVLARLEREGLSPSPAAEKERLLRRVTLDLTGLPPTLVEIDAFLADTSPEAYEHVIDRLLESPRYGERMAVDWLDAARYADTHGFNNDTMRYMWRWRDWVIEAFNQNMPFDRFTIEQLAGDLLPEPTLEQRIATGFNRNHVINSEGGIIPEEYRVEYVADRVHTTATVFMGLSMGCARCHDHKFDPITQREYYQFFAFFNNLNEQGEAGRVGNAEPTIKAPTREQTARLATLTAELATLEQAVQARLAAAGAAAEWEPKLRAEYENSPPLPGDLLARWAFDEGAGTEVAESGDPQHRGKIVGKAEWATGKLAGALKFDGNTHVDLGEIAGFERSDKFSYGAWINPGSQDALAVLARMDDGAAHRGYDLLLAEGKLTAHLIHHWPDNAIHIKTKNSLPLNQWQHVLLTYDGSSDAAGVKIYVDGKLQEVEVTNNNLTASIKTEKPLHVGRRNPGAPFRGLIDEVRIYPRTLSPAEVQAGADPIREILALAPDKRTPEQQLALRQHYCERFDPEYKRVAGARTETAQQQAEVEKGIPTAMVMQEMQPPRQAFTLKRGQYDQPDEKVAAGVPQSLPPLPAGAPPNRLGLAQWLVAPEHPLTARVAVNRYWQMYFGTGLVETLEDFGSQGEWPTHPELLDWLAIEFVRTGWNVKALQRLIVTSATYRQSSRLTPILAERDPWNRLLARGARFRLSAEAIRDNALAVSGLLRDKLGGPSVSPYQPAGLWEDVVVGADYEGTVYKQEHGDGLYRRGMYTFWKRTVPPPALNTFDAPEREVCTVRRARTNTPLQALVLLNDPTYLEAARMLAERMMTAGGDTPDARITYAFRLATARTPQPTEIAVLREAFEKRLASFGKDREAALQLLASGESPRYAALDVSELAAWTAVASMILNLDETITKG
jgi:mono/diheme cytochrome c family protein